MQDLLLKSATSGKSFKSSASRSFHYQQEPRRKPYDTKKRENPGFSQPNPTAQKRSLIIFFPTIRAHMTTSPREDVVVEAEDFFGATEAVVEVSEEQQPLSTLNDLGRGIQDQFAPSFSCRINFARKLAEMGKSRSKYLGGIRSTNRLQTIVRTPSSSFQRTVVFSAPKLSTEKKQLLKQELISLENNQAVERVQSRSIAFYSRIFLVPKADNAWRPIIDLSVLNKYLRVHKLHMETPESIQLAIQPKDWVISIDLADAYLHVPIHPDHQKYLNFAYQGQVWRFMSLPFGLSPAPWLFTMIAA